MDIDTRSKYLRIAKACADAAVERTTDPKVREMLLKVAAALRAAALSDRVDAAERTTDPKVHEILLKVAAVLSECADASEQTTDPKVRAILLKMLAHLRAAAHSAASGRSTPPKPRSPSRAA
jgi:hypothetical protein